MRKVTAIFLSIFVILLLFCYSDCYAALNNAGILDTVLDKYKAAATSWASVIQNYATRLFLVLMLISIVWTFFPLMFHRSSFPEIFGELIRFCAFFGFFLWLLDNGPQIANAILQSMAKIGNEAAGSSGTSPSKIVDIGFNVFSRMIKKLSIWEIGTSIGMFFTSAGVLICLALVAINMLLQLCSAWVLAYAGIFFLGFGGSKWTSDMAINYFKAVLGIGVSIMTMTLLVGIGTGIINEAHASLSEDLKLEELSVLVVFSLTLLLLTDKLPAMVAGIITGSSIGSMGIGNFGAGAVVGATMATSAAVTGAAAASVSAGLGGAGAVSAIRAAMHAGATPSGTTPDAGGAEGSGGRSMGDAMGVKPTSATKILAKNAASMAGAGLKNAVSKTKGGRLADRISGNSTKPDNS